MASNRELCSLLGTFDTFTVRKDVNSFLRKLRLKFHYSTSDEGADSDPVVDTDPFNNLQPKISKWTPKSGQNKTLDTFIQSTKVDLEGFLSPKPCTFKNLTNGERKALKSLKRNNNFVIKKADKGGATVVWRRDLYIAEAERQLSDAASYLELDQDDTLALQKKVTSSVNSLISSMELPESAVNLINPSPKTANFYLLPKIHKVNTPGRPIVSCHSCPTVFISEFLDSTLRPLVSSLPSFVQDSPHLLRLLSDFHFPESSNNNFFLFTMDVSSLYTSIPHNVALTALKFYLDQRSDQTSISTSTLLRLADLVLTSNSFQFNGRFFKQVKGVAMGTKMGPSVACLTLGLFEHNLFRQFKGTPPILFKRYIDDIFGAFFGTLEEVQDFVNFVSTFDPNFKFTNTISPSCASFLDLDLTIVDRSIKSNIHFKDTDSHNYLLYSSSHPPKCKSSIPFSQLLRAKRICSDDADFIDNSKQLSNFFSNRGYPDKVVQAANLRVQSISRSSILENKVPNCNSDRITLVLPFHPSVQPIKRYILKKFKTLMSDPTTKSVFQHPPLIAFKRDRNIGDHLVRSSHPQPPPVSNPGTYPCKRKRCNTCPVVSGDQLLTIQGPSNSFKVSDHFTCISSNVIYIISCKCCSILYVGETKRRLADRVTEHLRSIKLNLSGFPVAAHFNPPSLCTIKDFLVTAALTCKGTNIDRLITENRLIHKLGTLHPYGLNSKLESLLE